MGNSKPNLHDFSGPSQKMLFLYLIIKIRSPVMPFSQIWPTLPILEAIFGSGYVLGHFGGQICRFWFWLNFSNFFQLFYIEIVKLRTNFHNLTKNCPKLQKKVRTKAKRHEWKWWNMISHSFHQKKFTVPKLRLLAGPVSLMDENQFAAPKTKCFGGKNQVLFEMIQKGSNGPKIIKNLLCWSFGTMPF